MRDIKVRGWHTIQKVMYSPEEMAAEQLTLLPTGEFINVHGGSTMLSTIYPKDKFIPLQYTGLKDKLTLTDIYEGDIIDMDGNIRGNIYESPAVYKSLTTSVVAGMGYEEWEIAKQGLVRQGKLIAEQSDLPQILRELG